MSRRPLKQSLGARRYPNAGPEDLAKWAAFAAAALAAADRPGETKPLIKARKRVTVACAFPAGQANHDSACYRLWKEAERWTSLTLAGRGEAGPAFRQLAQACADAVAAATPFGQRARADLE